MSKCEFTKAELARQQAKLVAGVKSLELAERAEALAALARPAINLNWGDVAGKSKLGGRPDFPEGISWPIRPAMPLENRDTILEQWKQDFITRPVPLSLIAQLDLASMAEKLACLPPMPTSGMLYVFYDMVAERWPYEPEDHAFFKVIWLDVSSEDCTPMDPVDAELPIVPEVKFRANMALDPISPRTMTYTSVVPEGEYAFNDYGEWHLDHSVPGHKIGGWAQEIKGDMEFASALIGNGYKTYKSESYDGPHADDLRARETDWRLLLQIEPDGEANLNWGDAGRFYVWIRETDLAARRFDKCQAFVQST